VPRQHWLILCFFQISPLYFAALRLCARKSSTPTRKAQLCIALTDLVYYIHPMQTLVLRIPDDLARELETEAANTHCTKSEVARRRLIAAGNQAQDLPTGFALIADLVGTVEGGPSDVSSRKKEYLKTTGYGKSSHR